MTNKFTVVIGKNADDGFAYYRRQGWWKENKIMALAKKNGFVGKIKIGHWMEDLSGEGRTYRSREQIFDL